MEADNDAHEAEEEIDQIHLTLSHLSALTSLLTAIKIGSKQVSQQGGAVLQSACCWQQQLQHREPACCCCCCRSVA